MWERSGRRDGGKEHDCGSRMVRSSDGSNTEKMALG
jgi:hypothetical protein